MVGTVAGRHVAGGSGYIYSTVRKQRANRKQSLAIKRQSCPCSSGACPPATPQLPKVYSFLNHRLGAKGSNSLPVNTYRSVVVTSMAHPSSCVPHVTRGQTNQANLILYFELPRYCSISAFFTGSTRWAFCYTNGK